MEAVEPTPAGLSRWAWGQCAEAEKCINLHTRRRTHPSVEKRNGRSVWTCVVAGATDGSDKKTHKLSDTLYKPMDCCMSVTLPGMQSSRTRDNIRDVDKLWLLWVHRCPSEERGTVGRGRDREGTRQINRPSVCSEVHLQIFMHWRKRCREVRCYGMNTRPCTCRLGPWFTVASHTVCWPIQFNWLDPG